MQGAGGEIAFSKWANVYPDMKDSPDKFDVVWEHNETVDVKTTHHEHGHLEVSTNKKQGDVDIYALVIGEFPSFRVAGYMPAHTLMTDEYLYTHERTGSTVWRVPQEDLQ